MSYHDPAHVLGRFFLLCFQFTQPYRVSPKKGEPLR